MASLFVPWHKFFDELEKQPGRKAGLSTGLFNDRGALVDEIPQQTPKRQKRSVSSPRFRVRRDLETFTDLRRTNARATRARGHSTLRLREWSF
jgi:hypothetical protein